MLPNKQKVVLTDETDQYKRTYVVADDADVNKKKIVKDIQFFSKSSNLHEVKQDLLMAQRIEKFKKKVSEILKQIQKVLDENDDDKLRKIMIFLCQSAEDYLWMKDKDKCNALKKDVVCDIMAEHITDGSLVKSIIHLVMPSIKKSTMWRRNKQKIQKFCFFFFKQVANL